jgi:hypothetical protein
MTCIDLLDEVVVNLRALVVVFVVVAASVEVHSPPPRSPWPRQSKGSDMICRMPRWTRRNDRSLMQTVLANFPFLLVPLAAEKRRLCRPVRRRFRTEIRVRNGRLVCEALEVFLFGEKGMKIVGNILNLI